MTKLIGCAAYALKSLAAKRLLDGDGYDVTPTGSRDFRHTLDEGQKMRTTKGRLMDAGPHPASLLNALTMQFAGPTAHRRVREG